MSTASRYAITALIALLASPVGAEPLWRSPELPLDTRSQTSPSGSLLPVLDDTTQGRIVVRCDSEAAEYCASSADTYEQAKAKAEVIGETLLEIREWFEATGLLPSALHLTSDYERQVRLFEGYVTGTTRARITGEIQPSGDARVADAEMEIGSQIFEDKFGRSDLAHEWYHTASAATPDRMTRAEVAVDKLEEAIAEAVGMAFAFPDNDLIDNLALGAPLRLNEPFFHAPPNPKGYEKAPYILFVGDRLGAKNNIAHVRSIMDQLSDDGHRGMSYLYDPSWGSETFDHAFPEFVAQINQPSGDRYYGAVPSETWRAGAYGSFENFSIDRVIQSNAASPLLIETIEVSDLPDEPSDRLAVAELTIEPAEADAEGHIRMVYEHQVIADGTKRWLVPLEETNEGPFTRMTNAGPEPAATQVREAALEGTLNAMNFELPECMEPGETRMIRATGASLDDVSNFELDTSAGAVDGLAFTAPEDPGEVDVTLSISSTITRGPTIAPVQRDDVEVPLGTITIVEEGGCETPVCLEPGDSWQFAANNPALFGEHIAVDWSSDRGTINADGLFTAPDQPGSVTVTATAVENESMTAQATVEVGACCQFDIRIDGLLESQEAVTWSSSDPQSPSAFSDEPTPQGITLKGVDWETGTFERASIGRFVLIETAQSSVNALPATVDILAVNDDAMMYEYLPKPSDDPYRITYEHLWAGDGPSLPPVENWNPPTVPAHIDVSGLPMDPDMPALQISMRIEGPILVGRNVVNTVDGSGQWAMAEAIIAEPLMGSISIEIDGIFRPDFGRLPKRPMPEDDNNEMRIDWALDDDIAWCGGHRWEPFQSLLTLFKHHQ